METCREYYYYYYYHYHYSFFKNLLRGNIPLWYLPSSGVFWFLTAWRMPLIWLISLEAAGENAKMETFTIHDMLMNSTDLNKILCNFGIKNISECESEQDPPPEPKGTVDLSMLNDHQMLWNIPSNGRWICSHHFIFILISKCNRLSPVCAKRATALGIFFFFLSFFLCVSAHYAYGSGPP